MLFKCRLCGCDTCFKVADDLYSCSDCSVLFTDFTKFSKKNKTYNKDPIFSKKDRTFLAKNRTKRKINNVVITKVPPKNTL